jgi:hypothetical protein
MFFTTFLITNRQFSQPHALTHPNLTISQLTGPSHAVRTGESDEVAFYLKSYEIISLKFAFFVFVAFQILLNLGAHRALTLFCYDSGLINYDSTVMTLY